MDSKDTNSLFTQFVLLIFTLGPLFSTLTPLKYLNVCGLVAQSCPTLWTPWPLARRVPLSIGTPRQEYWNGLSFPSPGIFPTQGWKLCLLLWQAVLTTGRQFLYPWAISFASNHHLQWIFLKRNMLKLKLQHFDYLMQRVDSLEKTLMLGNLWFPWSHAEKPTWHLHTRFSSVQSLSCVWFFVTP